jgi:hypothetical protein
VKRWPIEWKKYLQTMPLKKGQYSKYIRDSDDSVIRKQIAQMKNGQKSFKRPTNAQHVFEKKILNFTNH